MSASLFLPIVSASLIGSLHCAGMCGPFAAFYSDPTPARGFARLLPHLSYHLGRLLTYTALGALAGSLGGVTDLAAESVGIGRIAAVVAGGLMIAWAARLLLEHAGVSWPGIGASGRLGKLSLRLMTRIRARRPATRGLLVGLSSTLLPCGWLYAFAVAAAGTGSTLSGMWVMLAFWSGTVPLLVGLGVGVHSLTHRLRRHVPILSAIALLAVGVAGVFGRLNAPALAFGDAKQFLGKSGVPAEPPCHTDKGRPR